MAFPLFFLMAMSFSPVFADDIYYCNKKIHGYGLTRENAINMVIGDIGVAQQSCLNSGNIFSLVEWVSGTSASGSVYWEDQYVSCQPAGAPPCPPLDLGQATSGFNEGAQFGTGGGRSAMTDISLHGD